jgi:hypothetical protein
MFALVLDPTGTPVPTFGTNGVARVAFGWKLQGANAVAVAPNGRLVLGGYTSNDAAIRSAVVRLRSDGTLDPTFSHDGRATVDVSAGGDQVNDLPALPGDVVAAGRGRQVPAAGGVVPPAVRRLARSDVRPRASRARTRAATSVAIAATADHHLVVVGLAGNGEGTTGASRATARRTPRSNVRDRQHRRAPLRQRRDEALDVAARGQAC